MTGMFNDPDGHGFKPERIQFQLAAVLDAEEELAEIEQIAARFDLDKVVRFLEVLVKVLRSFGWLVPKREPGDPIAAAV